MKWFERHALKEKESLTSEQIAFILSPSMTTFAPFNCLIRKHFDNLVVTSILYIVVGFLAIEDSPDMLIGASIVVIELLLLTINYFFIKHGRRLAWNRNQWKDFDAFKKSEKKWFGWAIFGVFLTFLFILNDSLDAPFKSFLLIMGNLLSICLPFIFTWYKKRKYQLALIKAEVPPPISSFDKKAEHTTI